MVKSLTAGARDLIYNNVRIQQARDGMMSLTDMWRAAGSPANKDPGQWARLSTTSDLERVLGDIMGKSHNLIRSKTGRTGGTFAHPIIAVSYAKYLSEEFHIWANSVVLERIHQVSDRADKWRAQGKSELWIRNRSCGMDIRHKFTDVLKASGAKDIDYGVATNDIYRVLFGRDKNGCLVERGLSHKDNLRDHLSGVELAEVMLAESYAEQALEQCQVHGREGIRKICKGAAGSVRKSRDDARQFISENTPIGHGE